MRFLASRISCGNCRVWARSAILSNGRLKACSHFSYCCYSFHPSVDRQQKLSQVSLPPSFPVFLPLANFASSLPPASLTPLLLAQWIKVIIAFCVKVILDEGVPLVHHTVQCTCSGWPKGNGKILSRSQAQLGQATCLADA